MLGLTPFLLPPSRAPQRQLSTAAVNGDFGALSELLSLPYADRFINWGDFTSYRTALICAASNGHERCVAALLEKGADVDARDTVRPARGAFPPQNHTARPAAGSSPRRRQPPTGRRTASPPRGLRPAE